MITEKQTTLSTYRVKDLVAKTHVMMVNSVSQSMVTGVLVAYLLRIPVVSTKFQH